MSQPFPGGQLVIAAPTGYTTAYEFDSSNNPVYAGIAVAGSSKAAAVWQIKKFVFTAGNLTDIQFADGVASFSKVWNSRASYTYS